MNTYKALNNQFFSKGNYSIAPIRMEDRHAIMQWRNEQIYHLRQNKPLNEEDQNIYFKTVVTSLFAQEQPDQILFSYLKGEKCIGYGGLVHINWIDKNAEISFIMDTILENTNFNLHWTTFLEMIEKVAFIEIDMHKIFVFAFDLRPHLYNVLEKNHYFKDGELKDHCYIGGQFKNIVIYSKIK